MPQPANKQLKLASQQGKSKLSGLVTLLVLVGLTGGLLANENRIFDYWRLRGYTPPANVAQLATDTTMNDYARHLFYLNKPGVLPTVASFRQHCPENQDTIVLGCYHSGENGIFVYDVPDPTLGGVQQVTAAHEMLHAAYGRLSHHDKTVLNAQLQAFYKHGLADKQVLDELKIYKVTEPDSLPDEMHSLFGTEITQLPPGLESYYKKFFTDRSKIVGYQARYQTQFTQRQDAIAADDKQLNDLKAQINAQQPILDSQLATITADRARINGYATSNNVAAYNAAVPGFNAEIDHYNAGIGTLQSLITSFNDLVAARNAIAGQLTTLDKALDTRTIQQMSH
jgi:hypothetical protein